MASSSVRFFSNAQNPFAKQEKVKYKNGVCISIDTVNSCFTYFSMENGDASTVKTKTKEFTSRPFTLDFNKELTDAVKEFSSLLPSMEDTSVVLVLPDNMVALDTISVPNINRHRNEEAVDATISGLFKNREQLVINRVQTVQNKQVCIYSVSVANKEFLQGLSMAMEDGGMKPTGFTFAANTTVNAVSQLAPKLKASSYMLMDIKENSAVIIFVANGKATGYYDLPFGYSVIQSNKVASEDMLFDHSVAELAVLNAKEKARAKKLTMMGGMNSDAEGEEGSEGDEENLDREFGAEEGSTVDPTDGTTAVTYKTLPKKTPRKLPKFMLRPEPTGEDETSYENFRIFMKWALTLRESNLKLTAQGAPEKIYVNFPRELEFLFDMVNGEKEENGIEFSTLEIRNGKDSLPDNLELYGAMFAHSQNRSNLFTL